MSSEYDADDEQRSLACCYKLLQMVGLLHSRGYQRLRISPYGRIMWWRCELFPAELSNPDNGALALIEDKHFEISLAARFSSGNGCQPFDWNIDISGFSVERLADMFVERFPRLIEESMGSDWVYAGWYQDMLRLTSASVLPLAYSFDEYESEYFSKLHLFRVGPESAGPKEMPLPPVYGHAQLKASKRKQAAIKAAKTRRLNAESMKESG